LTDCFELNLFYYHSYFDSKYFTLISRWKLNYLRHSADRFLDLQPIFTG